MEVEVLDRSRMIKRIREGFEPNTVVISYYGEDEKPVNFENGFHKPDALIVKRIDDTRFLDDIYDEDFKDIARFIMRNKNKNFICQCQCGISRSSATAMAIDEFFNHKGMKYFIDDRYNPNREFFKKIYNSLKELANE